MKECQGCGKQIDDELCICPHCGYTVTPYGTWKCVVEGYTSNIVLRDDSTFIWQILGVPASQGYNQGMFCMELDEFDKPEDLRICVGYQNGTRQIFTVRSLKQDEMIWEMEPPNRDRLTLTRIS